MIVRNVFSAKQVGTLYHYTNFWLACDIVRDGGIRGGRKLVEFNKMMVSYSMKLPKKYDNPVPMGISATRNKNFHRILRDVGTDIRFVLDGDNISDHYKIVPYNFFPSSYAKTYKKYPGGREFFRDSKDEQEEIILVPYSNPILPLVDKYVSCIELIDRGPRAPSPEELSDWEEEMRNLLDESNIFIPFKRLS